MPIWINRTIACWNFLNESFRSRSAASCRCRAKTCGRPGRCPSATRAAARAAKGISPVAPASTGTGVQGGCTSFCRLAISSVRLPGAKLPAADFVLRDGDFSALPVKTALAQLPTGAVRIRFGQIPPVRSRREGFPITPASTKHWSICRCQKILAAINPALLTRRSGQTQVEVPGDIAAFSGLKLARPPNPWPRLRSPGCNGRHTAPVRDSAKSGTGLFAANTGYSPGSRPAAVLPAPIAPASTPLPPTSQLQPHLLRCRKFLPGKR